MDSPFRSAAGKVLQSSPPPPQYVKYLPVGEIQSAWRSAQAPFRGPRPRKAAKRAGVVYQRRVEGNVGIFQGCVVELGPWFCFIDGSGARHYCQPDILLHRGDEIVVAEVKFRWTADAWWQLRKLYLPVLAKIFPAKKLLPLCICRSYDPAISVPDRVEIRRKISEACDPEILSVVLVS